MAAVSSGRCVAGTNTAGEASDTVEPVGEVPAATAVFCTVPASRSACVTVWVAAHVIAAPGARLATGIDGEHEPSVALASVTFTLESVTLPVFVAMTVNATTWPTVS